MNFSPNNNFSPKSDFTRNNISYRYIASIGIKDFAISEFGFNLFSNFPIRFDFYYSIRTDNSGIADYYINYNFLTNLYLLNKSSSLEKYFSNSNLLNLIFINQGSFGFNAFSTEYQIKALQYSVRRLINKLYNLFINNEVSIFNEFAFVDSNIIGTNNSPLFITNSMTAIRKAGSYNFMKNKNLKLNNLSRLSKMKNNWRVSPILVNLSKLYSKRMKSIYEKTFYIEKVTPFNASKGMKCF